MPFNEKLRALREDKDLKQSDIAEVLNIKQQRISRLELGISEPTLSEIAAICRYFGISSDELLELPDEE